VSAARDALATLVLGMAAYDPPVADPRLEAYARLLVERSIDPQPGWQVLVATTTEARPLAQELSRQLARRGAHALTRIYFGGLYPLDVDWIAAAPAELALELAPLEQQVVDAVDGSIFVLAPEDPPADADLSPDARRAFRSRFSAYRARGRAGQTREVRCDFPTPYFARQAGLSLAEYEDVFYNACLRDWDEEGRRMRPVLARFDRADQVRIVADGTDLTLSLAGREGRIDDGHVNIPGGEVYYCPVEDSVDGVIEFDFPSGKVERPRLVLRAGEVVDASAAAGEDALLSALETDDGARRFGELGLGCNEGIARHLRNVLFDEKMAGTIHLALGAGFPVIGGRNESALHWDLVKDMRRGGELWCDGELVQRDGSWLL
jgi:aminopeptidase